MESSINASVGPAWGTRNDEIPVPDILWSAINQERLPGDGRQRKALRTVTAGEERRKDLGGVLGEESRDKLCDVSGEVSRDNLSGISTVERGEAVSSVLVEESEGDTSSASTRSGSKGGTSGASRRSGEPGGRTPELRPQSGESGASAGTWGRSY
ncbi:hypothetical protein NDU88_004959 [Pleurodeles waltl]|uniref:Uncharacterized protein n=1 Tax=Pleurodeles waltl TaxID=8319 RepID=A0AAV7UHU6_PLEWA|nr:hypothetical protein NDU88_004959 [Pleurodeles waltl]